MTESASTRGPFTVILACPEITATGKGPEEEVEVSTALTVNSAPRAGQYWEIVGVSYIFPNAKILKLFGKPGLEGAFRIQMQASGLLVAKQEILSSIPASAVEPPAIFNNLHAIGSLEPSSPVQVYAGQGVNFTVTVMAKGSTAGQVSTRLGGQIIMNYNLVTYRGRSV